jgi:hypothetical protein
VCAFLRYRVLCALQSVERALRLGRPRWLMGHASRPPVRALCAWAKLGFDSEVV